MTTKPGGIKRKYPKEINGVTFTPREIDIIACIVNGRGIKKIAASLKIASKTAESHVRNIMLKIECGSREHIIDFVEKSEAHLFIKQHYLDLLNLTNNHSYQLDYQINHQKGDSRPDEFNRSFSPAEEKRVFTITTIANKLKKLFSLKPRWSLMLALGLCVLVLYVGLNTYQSIPLETLRTELPVPQESTLLKRTALIEQINAKFRGADPIKTVVLAGVGGAGKTTTARLYAREQKDPVLWELNAENLDTLLSSFESLAYALAKTESEKQEVNRLKANENIDERKNQILYFVKSRLKKQNSWFLIFDNVDSFKEIKNFFPYDPKVWGRGRILITTRDRNYVSNS